MAKNSKSKKSELGKFSDDIKRHFDAKTEESKRHFDVVAEAQDDKWKLVAEQYGGINTKLDAVVEQVAGLTIDMGIVKQQLQIINSGLKRKVEAEEFEALERRVASLEKRR